MIKEIKRAVIKLEIRDNNFLPLSKGVPKELFPLGDRPLLDYILEEISNIGVREVVFLSPRKDQGIKGLFQGLEKTEKELKDSDSPHLDEFQEFASRYKDISFSFSSSLKEGITGAGNFIFISPEYLFFSDITPLEQLMKVFRTSERPVIGLKRVEGGDIKAEKIARRLYKIESLEKENDFIFAGRAIFTANSVSFFNGETIKDALEEMNRKGHTVYGIELEGEYFKMVDKVSWLKASNYYTFKKSSFSSKLKDFIEKEKLI